MPEAALPAHLFARVDEAPDADFYAEPRFVAAHRPRDDRRADGALPRRARVGLEAARPDVLLGLAPAGRGRLRAASLGLGMNAEELAANPRLDAWRVHDLNADARPALRRRELRRRSVCGVGAVPDAAGRGVRRVRARAAPGRQARDRDLAPAVPDQGDRRLAEPRAGRSHALPRACLARAGGFDRAARRSIARRASPIRSGF